MSLRSVLSAIAITFLLAFTENPNAKAGTEQKSVYKILIVQEAWHTGIILEVEDIPETIWPEKKLYTKYKFIDISWGDEKFYQADGRPPGLALRAVLWPTQSVLRIYPFNTLRLSAYGSDARMESIIMDKNEFFSLCKFISESFMRDESGNVCQSTFRKNSRYYFLAKRKYHLFRTCNTWVALALRQSGLNIRSGCILNANQLFRQLKKTRND